jgi:hypothetical protein
MSACRISMLMKSGNWGESSGATIGFEAKVGVPSIVGAGPEASAGCDEGCTDGVDGNDAVVVGDEEGNTTAGGDPVMPGGAGTSGAPGLHATSVSTSASFHSLIGEVSLNRPTSDSMYSLQSWHPIKARHTT